MFVSPINPISPASSPLKMRSRTRFYDPNSMPNTTRQDAMLRNPGNTNANADKKAIMERMQRDTEKKLYEANKKEAEAKRKK